MCNRSKETRHSRINMRRWCDAVMVHRVSGSTQVHHHTVRHFKSFIYLFNFVILVINYLFNARMIELMPQSIYIQIYIVVGQSECGCVRFEFCENGIYWTSKCFVWIVCLIRLSARLDSWWIRMFVWFEWFGWIRFSQLTNILGMINLTARWFFTSIMFVTNHWSSRCAQSFVGIRYLSSLMVTSNGFESSLIPLNWLEIQSIDSQSCCLFAKRYPK